ncbi:MAG: M48 family metallopeptidase [Sphingomonadaceae bacterium]
MTPLDAWLYDGITAARQIVRVRRDGDRLLIEGKEPVAITDLIPRGDKDRAVFGRKGDHGWRLGFDGPLPQDWRDALPTAPRYGRLIDRIGLIPAIVGGVAVSAAVVFGLYRAPELIAPLVPERWEQALGDTLVGDLGGRVCVSPEGQRVLDRLGAQLSNGPRTMRVRVVNIPIPNAVALPGGQIALFDGLIEQATSPDEIAGVLGHEIGHVAHRHVMAGLIRQFGLGLVLGGGKGLQYAQALLDARYSRGAESEADGYAIAALTANHISTRPTADFFARMGKGGATGNSTVDTAVSWLSSHPGSAKRRDRFRAADKAITNPRPAMSAAEWAAVKAMCGTKKPDQSKR